jgi:cellulose 1,4-beta-cellobiosidase
VVDSLSEHSNVYLYVDIAHSSWLGWDDNFNDAVHLYASIFRDRMNSVDGFITNTANYVPNEEIYLTDPEYKINGLPIRSSDFYEWNSYFDEKSFATDMREALIKTGFPQNIGMLIDTYRNGWGGPMRPDAVSTSGDLNTYVNESRLDTRPHRFAQCNQDGAGIGERPTASPAYGIDAYVWVKPPGESDGTSEETEDPDRRPDERCRPDGMIPYTQAPTNALPNAPNTGQWFEEQFEMLVKNAFPPL